MKHLVDRIEQRGGYVSEKMVADIKRFTQYIDYIQNCGEKCLVSWFDNDWKPIGNMVRKDMGIAGLIKIKDNEVILIG